MQHVGSCLQIFVIETFAAVKTQCIVYCGRFSHCNLMAAYDQNNYITCMFDTKELKVYTNYSVVGIHAVQQCPGILTIIGNLGKFLKMKFMQDD